MIKRVSIVVITYNGERFLAQQLDTLIAQTYPIYEIIVQDDGSMDGTEFCRKDGRDPSLLEL